MMTVPHRIIIIALQSLGIKLGWSHYIDLAVTLPCQFHLTYGRLTYEYESNLGKSNFSFQWNIKYVIKIYKTMNKRYNDPLIIGML